MTERCQGRISFFVGIRLFVIEKPPTDADVHTNTILTPLLSFRARRLPSPEKQSLDRDRHRLRWRRRRRRESRRWPWERSCPRCRFVPHGEFQTLSRRHLNLTPSKIDSSPDDMLKTNGNARRSDALVPTPCFHCSPGHLVHAAKTMAQARSTRADWGDLPLSSPPPSQCFCRFSQRGVQASDARFVPRHRVVRSYPREAFLFPSKTVSAHDAIGLASAETVCPYPPGELLSVLLQGNRGKLLEKAETGCSADTYWFPKRNYASLGCCLTVAFRSPRERRFPLINRNRKNG